MVAAGPGGEWVARCRGGCAVGCPAGCAVGCVGVPRVGAVWWAVGWLGGGGAGGVATANPAGRIVPFLAERVAGRAQQRSGERTRDQCGDQARPARPTRADHRYGPALGPRTEPQAPTPTVFGHLNRVPGHPSLPCARSQPSTPHMFLTNPVPMVASRGHFCHRRTAAFVRPQSLYGGGRRRAAAFGRLGQPLSAPDHTVFVRPQVVARPQSPYTRSPGPTRRHHPPAPPLRTPTGHRPTAVSVRPHRLRTARGPRSGGRGPEGERHGRGQPGGRAPTRREPVPRAAPCAPAHRTPRAPRTAHRRRTVPQPVTAHARTRRQRAPARHTLRP